MEENKFYTIMVGGKEPAEVMVGYLNKDNGQPDGNQVAAKIGVGFNVIPNYSRVWGKRGIEKDGKPNGKIEFLTWGDLKGESIEVRWLPNSNSLDKLYQTNVQKLTVQDKDAEISLLIGINKFDYKTQKMLIEFLKVHTFNGDSKSRDPENTNIDFVEYNPSNKIKSNTDKIHMRRLAEEYVLDSANDPERIAILANIFEMNQKDLDEVIYENLLQKSMDDPKTFLFIITHKRDQVKIKLQAAADQSLIDFALPGSIQLRDGVKKTTLIDGLEELEDQEEIINFLAKNFTEPKYHEAISTIIKKLELVQHAQYQ